MADYVLDPIVEDELWAIWLFIAKDNPEAATRVIESAYETFKLLAANPESGRLRKFENPRLSGIRSRRVVGFNNYLVFYQKKEEYVRILHVYYGARDIESLFA